MEGTLLVFSQMFWGLISQMPGFLAGMPDNGYKPFPSQEKPQILSYLPNVSHSIVGRAYGKIMSQPFYQLLYGLPG